MADFSDRVGLHDRFFELDKGGHLAVEAPIDHVSSALSGATGFFRLGEGAELEVRVDQVGAARRPDDSPLGLVFQLDGSRWTQARTDLRSTNHLALARELSSRLSTRVLAAEITDDAYYSHALFDRGRVLEITLSAMNVDVKNVLTMLQLTVPDAYATLDSDGWEDIEEADYAYRDGTEQLEGRDLSTLVRELECYLHAPLWADDEVWRLVDLGPADVVRLDTIWRS